MQITKVVKSSSKKEILGMNLVKNAIINKKCHRKRAKKQKVKQNFVVFNKIGRSHLNEDPPKFPKLGTQGVKTIFWKMGKLQSFIPSFL